MYAAKIIFKVVSIWKQDTTVHTVVMFVAMDTEWMIFELKYGGKLIVTGQDNRSLGQDSLGHITSSDLIWTWTDLDLSVTN